MPRLRHSTHKIFCFLSLALAIQPDRNANKVEVWGIGSDGGYSRRLDPVDKMVQGGKGSGVVVGIPKANVGEVNTAQTNTANLGEEQTAVSMDELGNVKSEGASSGMRDQAHHHHHLHPVSGPIEGKLMRILQQQHESNSAFSSSGPISVGRRGQNNLSRNGAVDEVLKR